MYDFPLTGAQRTFLRGLGQRLEPALKVGRGGLTPAFFAELQQHLRRHELVKLRFLGAERDERAALCTQIADEYNWGFVNVNLRPYYAEGSKTVGNEIAEQLGWRLPDNVVCPMAGGSLIRKIKKAFDELVALGLVEAKDVKFFGAQATGCSPISTAVKNGREDVEPQRPLTIARSLAIGNPADGIYAIDIIKKTGGSAATVTDDEVVDGIKLLAEMEGIFTETAGGVTIGVLKKLAESGQIGKDETVVAYITGIGLKTQEAVAGKTSQPLHIKPNLSSFEDAIGRKLG